MLDDESMQRTVESVAQYGVLAPLIARPRPEGGYEIISGHRRQHAAELAGLDTLPVIVREMDDDAAVILMVDSNLQRENILPSERAFAYKMKLDAMKHQAGRPVQENYSQLGNNFGKLSSEEMAEELGTSVITNITEIALDGDKVTAKQETEEGYRTVEASAPCVVTVTKPEYDPRYPTIKNKMAARKKPIGDIKEADLADLEKEKVGESNAKVQIVKLYEPAKKEAGIKIQEETPEDSAMKAVAMMADAKVF